MLIMKVTEVTYYYLRHPTNCQISDRCESAIPPKMQSTKCHSDSDIKTKNKRHQQSFVKLLMSRWQI